nr:lipopolysaccharide biosynthesis protein [Odoribacter splanchnicus]
MKKISNQGVISNVFWSGIDKFSVQFVQLLTTIIIARIISPAEFGLVAMITVFLAVAQILVDSGFCTALIQRQNCDNKDYSTVFYFNLFFSLILYCILYLSAPAIAQFYNEPELIKLTRFIGINIIISAFSYVQRTLLTITMELKKQAKISFISIIVGAITGIVLAYKGYGVWALVMQTLIANLLDSILLWSFTCWKPMLFFSLRSFKKLFPFGSKILLSSLIQTLYTNLYTLVIGRVYSAVNIGYFNRVQTILNLLSINIMNIIDRPVYAHQCQNQSDKMKTKEIFDLYLRISSFIIFPIMMGVCVLAKPLIISLLTEKWLPAVPFLQVLSIAYLFTPVSVVNSNILKVMGDSGTFLKSGILKRILGIIILFITMKSGLLILCYGLVLYNLCDFMISLFFAKKVIQTSWKEQIMSLIPVFLLSCAMCICIYWGIHYITSYILKLCCGIIIGILVYFLLGALFKFKEIKLILSYIR